MLVTIDVGHSESRTVWAWLSFVETLVRKGGFRWWIPPFGPLTARPRVAQAEREAISRRTKEALAVAKARGVKLGNPNGAASLRRAGKGGAALRSAVSANAAAFATDLTPVLEDIRATGHTSLRAVAAELTAREIQTRRGGKWNVGNVLMLLRRRPHPMPIPATREEVTA